MIIKRALGTTFEGGLPSGDEATSGFSKLQKNRTRKKFVPKASLGQNFLKSESALKKIVEAGEIKPGGTILEIGPGKGALTEKLLEKGAIVIAIEKDKDLFGFLKLKFEKELKLGILILIHGDILDFNVRNHIKNANYKIIANIPYNITGTILKKFLTESHQPVSMTLLLQHEVAKRIVANDKKESMLSISVKAYGTPRTIDKVEARYFSPKPKVGSAIITIKDISREMFEKNKINEKIFWNMVKTGFAHKRKKLGNNLKNTKLGQNTPLVNLRNKRAEDLSLQDWISLAK